MSRRLTVYDERNETIKTLTLHADPDKAQAQIDAEIDNYQRADFKVTTNPAYPDCWLLTKDDEWRVACIEQISPRLVLTGRREIIRTKTVTELYSRLGENK